MGNVTRKRIYEAAAETDGYRILVDRLWPRGVSREEAEIDLWLKEAGPSDDLRKWFGHEPARYEEFAKRYREELTDNSAFRELEEAVSAHDTVTLVYSAKDEEHNQARVLEELLSSG